MNISRITITILSALTLFSCNSKIIYRECYYDTLCDSSLFFSFTINEDTITLEQNYSHQIIYSQRTDSITKEETGYIAGNVIDLYGDNNIIDGELRITGEFLESELNINEPTEPYFYYNASYILNGTNDDTFLQFYKDSIFAKKTFTYTDSSYFDSTYYYEELSTEIPDTIFKDNGNYSIYNGYHEVQLDYSGIDLSMFLDSPYDTSYLVSMKNETKNNKSYFLVTRMTPLNDHLYIIEGEFKLNAFSYSNDSIKKLCLDNGKFKLFISTPNTEL